MIKISFWQSLKIKLIDISCCIKKDSHKLWKLYDQGQKQLDKEMDITKIIKDLRNLGVYMKLKEN